MGQLRRGAVVLAVLGGWMAIAAATLTPEVSEALRTVRSVTLAPDGESVLYLVQEPRGADDDPGPARHTLWRMPATGGTPVRLTDVETDAGSPAWSPDGARISFLSDRRWDDEEEKTRLFIMPADGGEARPVSPADMSVAVYRWAPDSEAIAFVAEDPDSEEKKQAGERKEDWKQIEEDWPVRRLRLVAATGGEARGLTGDEVAVWDFDWAPNGTRIVTAVTDVPRTDDQYMKQRLELIDLEGGEPLLLFPANGKLGQPRFSPDGRRIAFLGATDEHDPAAGTVYVLPVSGGPARALGPDQPANFRFVHWVDDGTLAACGEEGVQTLLARIDADEGRFERLVADGPIFNAFSVSDDGRRWAFAGHAPDHPAELFVYEPATGERPQRRTRHNPDLDAIDLASQGSYRWTARDGLSIEGVLIRPPGYVEGRRYPLLITPHGGPESASMNGWNSSYVYLGQLAAARGWFVLLPNYRASTGRGEAYSRADHLDLGGAEFDDVLDAIEALDAEGRIDPARVAIAGGSYGGYFAGLGATRHSDRFAAAVVFAGISNWVSFQGTSDIPIENSHVHWGVDDYLEHLPLLWERSPMAHLKEARTPTLILHGEQDLRVPIGQGLELATALRLKGVPVRMVAYPRAGHGLRERAQRLDAIRRVIDWIERYTPDGRTEE